MSAVLPIVFVWFEGFSCALLVPWDPNMICRGIRSQRRNLRNWMILRIGFRYRVNQ